uniref:Uncharacterized protein n=1 Tax=Thermodesulfobacterium geofontis TaxID=1295609 RepID=A0A7V5XFB6_9BACT
MKNYKPILEKFFKNQLSSPEYKTFLTNLKRIIKKAFDGHFNRHIESLFAKYYGPDYLKALSHELLLKLIDKKNTILNHTFIHENYLISVVVNLIYYHLSSDFKTVEKETNFEDLYLSKDPEEEENLKLEEVLPKLTVDHLESLRLLHIIEVLKQHLTPKEIETLCCYVLNYIYKQEAECKVNKNVLYKRWERLKPKLRAILGYEIFEEISPYKLFELIKSELC